MTTIEIIENKTTSLGGIIRNSACEDEIIKINNNDLFSEIERRFNAELPSFYKELYNLYGPFSFNKNVRVKCIEEKKEIEDDGGLVRVAYFFSLQPNVNCSIDRAIRSHPELLKHQLLPICNGESGDLICIDLTKDRYENVFYWFHEAFEGEELTLISKTVKDFWMKLQIREDDRIDEEAMKNIQVKASPKLLEMLRKSGYGPKE